SAFLTFTLIVASFLPPLTFTSWVPSLASLAALTVTLPSATLAVRPASLGASADSAFPAFTFTSLSVPGRISISSTSNTRASAESPPFGEVGAVEPQPETNARVKVAQKRHHRLIRTMFNPPYSGKGIQPDLGVTRTGGVTPEHGLPRRGCTPPGR